MSDSKLSYNSWIWYKPTQTKEEALKVLDEYAEIGVQPHVREFVVVIIRDFPEIHRQLASKLRIPFWMLSKPKKFQTLVAFNVLYQIAWSHDNGGWVSDVCKRIDENHPDEIVYSENAYYEQDGAHTVRIRKALKILDFDTYQPGLVGIIDPEP